MADLKRILKTLRATQPLNFVTTSVVRALSGLGGGAPEVVIRHLHRMGPVNARLPNGRHLKLWSRADDWVSNQVFWRGWAGYEPETVPLFFERAKRARLIVDVGAYVGFYSLLAAHANPQATVLAFEPFAPSFERLQRNVARNRLANVRCMQLALGEHDASATLFHGAVDLPCGSSLSPQSPADPDLVGSAVTVRALDGWLDAAGLEGVDLVKIDTETTEPEVLRGMKKVLARDRPDVFCEVLEGRGTGPALEEVLGPVGYRYYLLTAAGPQERATIAGDARYLNYLFSAKALGGRA